jgi:DNA-binding NtrC family response regulator
MLKYFLVLIIFPILSGHRQSVAVIDDEEDLANLYAVALNTHGIRAIPFYNPLAAVDHLNIHHNGFRLIITDWRMPSMSGLELAKFVQQIDSEIIIIVISAFDLDTNQLAEIPKSEYLRKPIHINRLLESVKGMLNEPQIITD